MKKSTGKQVCAVLLSLLLLLTSMVSPATTVYATTGNEPQSITLNVKSKVTMYVGTSKKIKVKGVTPKRSSRKVTYESSDSAVLKVTGSGNMKALTEGKATVTVTSTSNKEVSRKIAVTVKNLVKNKTYNKMVIALDKKPRTKKLSRASKVKTSYLKFSSSKKKVATVSAVGTLKGKKVGNTKITIGGKKGIVKGAKQVITLYVAKKSVETVALDKTSVTLKPTETVKLTTTVTPEEAANVVVYTTSDEKVAAVNQSGEVTALQEGTAEITAITVDGSKKAVCVVTVSKGSTEKSTEAGGDKESSETTAENDKTEATTEKNQGNTTGDKTEATTEKNTGNTTGDKTEATTEKNTGNTTGDKTEATTGENQGNTTEEKTEATTSEPTNPEIPQDKDACVTLDKESITLDVGDIRRLTATVTPDTIMDKTVTFSSADNTVVTVNQAGSIEGISAGTTVITAKILGGTKATCAVTVREPKPDSKLFEVPYVSTYYFNPKPTIYDEIVIPVYITDYEQSEYLNNDTTKTMDLLYEVDGTEYRLENLKLGDNQVTLGKLSEGIHTFTLQSVDRVTGQKSHKLYNELWVINPETYEITKEQTYEITDNDLEQYGIKKDNSTDPTDMIRTRDGLTELF